jgi:hypothetical protein
MTLKAVVLLFVIVLILPGASLADEEAQRPAWSVEPELSAGYVYEFTQYASTYTGVGLSVRYMPGPWIALGSYREEDYVMTYFGITNGTINQIFSGQQLIGPFLTFVNVAERRTVEELMVGRRSSGNGFAILAGFRSQALDNSFSSMRSTGPCARAEGRLSAPVGRISWRIDGAQYTHDHFDNHRLGWRENEYVLPDGERTISYFGEPKYGAGWGLAIGPRAGAGKRFSVGYEGSIITLKYGYRHYHGFSVRGEF